MDRKVWVQPQLPEEMWAWEQQAQPRPLHPCMLPPEPGRRVFAVIDGGGEGDGQPCAQLVLIHD